MQLAFVALTVAAAFAAELVRRGNLLEVRWVLIAHIAAGAVADAALLPLAWRLGTKRPAARGGSASRTVRRGLLVVVPAAAAGVVSAYPNPDDRIVNPSMAPLSMHEEGGGPRSPFFPSSAQTNVGGTIPSDFFMDSELCGECHKDIYEQWKSSAHHFASFNNQFYRKSIEYMQAVVGTQAEQVVRGLPRSRGVLQRPLRAPDQGADRHAGGAGRAGVHVVPCHHARRQLDGQRRVHDRVPAAASSWPRAGSP